MAGAGDSEGCSSERKKEMQVFANGGDAGDDDAGGGRSSLQVKAIMET